MGPGDPKDEKQNTAVGILGVGNPEDIAMFLQPIIYSKKEGGGRRARDTLTSSTDERRPEASLPDYSIQ